MTMFQLVSITGIVAVTGCLIINARDKRWWGVAFNIFAIALFSCNLYNSLVQ